MKKKSVLDQFVEICLKEKELAAQKAALKEEVIKTMDSDGLKNFLTPEGTLTITVQNRWTYTKDALAEKKLAVRELERKFVSDGRASLKEIRFPQFFKAGEEMMEE